MIIVIARKTEMSHIPVLKRRKLLYLHSGKSLKNLIIFMLHVGVRSRATVNVNSSP